MSDDRENPNTAADAWERELREGAQAEDDLGIETFGADWTPPVIPGQARDYWSMLHSLCKTLTRNAGFTMGYTEEQQRAAKITLAEWTRGIFDTEAGRKVSADVGNLLRINRVADSLPQLWAWYDDPNT